jgi:hypothetical protein
MGLNTQYIPSKYFQEGILDKDTGCPLAAGIVTFYSDSARTQLKPIYKISGSPPNYTYEEIPNPQILSSIGTFQDDSGNDVIPYFYPYDANGNLELYYATIESSTFVSQFTREGFPNASAREVPVEEIENYIPNGQFINHTEFLEQNTVEQGEITQAVTDIAQGGWTFERESGTTGKDIVTFDRFGSPVANPTGFPRYAVRIKNEIPGSGDLIKGLRLKFRDVNKFASDTAFFTFSFSGKSNSGGPSNIRVNLIKNYGSGGSAEEIIEISNGEIALPINYETFNIPFTFGLNDGKTIGDDDDDFIQLEIFFPLTTTFDDSFTNFVLASGDIELSQFPVTPTSEFQYKSLAGLLPAPEYANENIYLPVRLGPQGMEYDTTQIGKIYATMQETVEIGELQCNGQILQVDDYSSDGIPYRRLWAKWTIPAIGTGVAFFGTGINYVTASNFSATQLDITANIVGAATNAADGTIPTGFTFVSIPSPPFHIDRITVVAGSSITSGAYFNYYTPGGRHFIAWYEVDGSGSQPATAANFYRKVSILSADTIAQVRDKTIAAINSFSFTVVDLRGYFLRTWDDGSGVDPDAAIRADRGDGTTGDHVGTIQQDDLARHKHVITGYPQTLNTDVTPGDHTPEEYWFNSIDTKETEYAPIAPLGNETRSKNIYVNAVVKY